MFRGSSNHTIDPKGRIIIPARFREPLRQNGGDNVVVSKLDGCLVAYPQDEWSNIEARILALAEKSDAMRRFRRVFIGGAFDLSCDKQGRVLIPPTLRAYAGLEKEILLVGVINHFEIWAKDRFEQETLELEADMKAEGLRNEVARLGL